MVSARARTHPFTETGIMWGWIGNPFIGTPFAIATRTELLRAVLSSKQRLDKAWVYQPLADIFGCGLINRYVD